MAKRATTREKLLALKALEDAPLNQELEKMLHKTLSSANNILVAKAAQIDTGTDLRGPVAHL